MSSSIGRVRNRRPSLVEWTQHLSRYPSMDFDRRLEQCNSFMVEFQDENGSVIGGCERMQAHSGQKLHDCLEQSMRQRGLVPSTAVFFLENSSTPLPQNCNASFLAGQRIVARARGSMTRFVRYRTQHLTDGDTVENTAKCSFRKNSEENLSVLKNSLVNSKILSRSRGNNALVFPNNGCQELEPKIRKSSTSVQASFYNIPFDEPSCSEEPFTAVACEDTGTRRLRNAAGGRRSLFFGKDKSDIFTRLNLIKDELHETVTEFELESHWTKIVENSEELSKRAYEHQEAIWEFVTTEHHYLQLLKQMNELWQCFLRIQESGFMRDIDPRRVFLNYPELYFHNSKFWKRALLPMLRKTRESGKILDPSLLKCGFERIDEWWSCYTVFIHGHRDCYSYVQRSQKENDVFRDFVMWAESQETMRRQRFLDALTNPMQRLTRYSLLLKAVLRHSNDETEREIIQEMIFLIEKATRNVEETLNSSDLQNKLNDLSKTIESYDAVDSEEFERVFSTKCFIRLSDPMPYFVGQPRFRRVYLRGDLRLKDGKQGTKIDAHCILFTDLFLICKANNKRYERLRVLKPPIHISKMCLQQYCDYSGFVIAPVSDFGAPSAIYHFWTQSIEDTKKWLEVANMAIRDFYRLKPLSPHHCLLGLPAALQNNAPTNIDLDKSNVNTENGPNLNSLPDIVHRKSASMDSQLIAEKSRVASVRKVNTISSADHIDRLLKENAKLFDSSEDVHKSGIKKIDLDSSNSNLIMGPSNITQSISSVDLLIDNKTLDAETSTDSFAKSIETTENPQLKSRSRSHSSTRDTSDKSSVTRKSEFHNSNGSVGSLVLQVQDSSASRSSSIAIDNGENSANLVPITNNTRRFERRYHTSDGIDVEKPSSMNMPQGILKRFSWNVTTAIGVGSSKKINRMNDQNARRQSQSTITSTESFSSSTSGFSTSSSHVGGSTTTEKAAMNGINISTVAIEDPSDDSVDETRTLKLQMSDLEKDDHEPPPLPDLPPPQLIDPKLNCNKCISPKHQELLKFIMDTHLETSDV